MLMNLDLYLFIFLIKDFANKDAALLQELRLYYSCFHRYFHLSLCDPICRLAVLLQSKKIKKYYMQQSYRSFLLLPHCK